MSLGNPDQPIGGLAVRPPAGVELEPLGRDDLATVVAMGRERRGLPPLEDPEPLRDRYDALLNSADTVAFLALDGGAAAGLVVLQLRRRLNFATFEGWLSELYVVPARRGRGIGQALLQAALAEWRLRGGHRVLTSVAAGERDGSETLRRAGFEEGFLDFRLAPVPSIEAAVPEGVDLRPLGPDDGVSVTRLIAEFGTRRSPVPDRMPAVLRTYAAHARDVAAGRAASLVAVLEGATVGVCTLEWQHPFWTQELHAWIPDLVVTEPLRGRGIGKALMVEALHRAGRTGASEVRLESGAQRRAAHGLYRSLGFETTGRTWVLRRED